MNCNDTQAYLQACQPAATGGEGLKLSPAKLTFIMRWLRTENNASEAVLKAFIIDT